MCAQLVHRRVHSRCEQMPLRLHSIAFPCSASFNREGVDVALDRLLRLLQHDPPATDVGQLALKGLNLIGP